MGKIKQYSIIHIVPVENGWELRPENVHAQPIAFDQYLTVAKKWARKQTKKIQLWEEIPENE